VDVTYDLLSGAAARPLAGQVRDLYAEVYAEPPYHEGPQHVAQLVRWLAAELDRPGFALARAQADDTLAGAAYGFTLPAGEWMEPAASEPPPAIRDVPKFTIAEWMVRASYRGTGIGRRLLDLILDGRAEPYAILASNPAAVARGIYARWGWTKQGIIRPRSMPEMDVLVLPLTPASRP
jgi:GNAT superfamily N-acetyltransferase